jgi:hypothetical protein
MSCPSFRQQYCVLLLVKSSCSMKRDKRWTDRNESWVTQSRLPWYLQLRTVTSNNEHSDPFSWSTLRRLSCTSSRPSFLTYGPYYGHCRRKVAPSRFLMELRCFSRSYWREYSSARIFKLGSTLTFGVRFVVKEADIPVGHGRIPTWLLAAQALSTIILQVLNHVWFYKVASTKLSTCQRVCCIQ